ncbi:MAG: molybdate ABC transporter substrate-binding protein, partial [Betaproteobacteria bacterium]|nr:molybdate ABC transporter substrate-binding protein [Betaproteobacteria bacterium]
MVRTAVALLLVGWVLPMPVGASEVHVAVAANFTAPMQKLAGMFERQT